MVQRGTPGGGTLADVLDRVLDKGIVVDAWARVSLVGFEVLTVEARVVVASVETYLKYAEAIGTVKLASKPGSEAPPKQVPMEVTPAESKPSKPTEQLEPSADDVVGYLTEHADGLPLEELQEHFHAPRELLEKLVASLVNEHRLHKDDSRNVLLPEHPEHAT